jgi:HK97 family phage major capsid protein
MQFVAKTGNATNQTNPWGYPVQDNVGSPNTNTTIWQLPVRAVTAQLPIRSAVLSDVNALESTIVEDLILEFSKVEAASMAINDDQSGSTTTSTGATSGLRGLDSYASDTTSAFGTSGTAITNGIHTIATVAQTSGGVTYNNIVDLVNAFPSQYWALPGNAFHILPSMIDSLRSLKDTQGLPLFLEMGDEDAAAVGRMFGFPVIPNPYLSSDFPIYLANWNRFLTIGDSEEISIQMMDQTAPGFVTIYAEKRVVSSVRDPFAGARMSA